MKIKKFEEWREEKRHEREELIRIWGDKAKHIRFNLEEAIERLHRAEYRHYVNECKARGWEEESHS